MFENFHFTFNCESIVSHDVFKNEKECQLMSTFSYKMSSECCMPSSKCHFISILSIDVVFFFTMLESKLCVSIDVQFIFVHVFVCQMA